MDMSLNLVCIFVLIFNRKIRLCLLPLFLSLEDVLSGFGMRVILALKNSLEVFLFYLIGQALMLVL